LASRFELEQAVFDPVGRVVEAIHTALKELGESFEIRGDPVIPPAAAAEDKRFYRS
jgi:hypothetical protein